jgi:flagellar M-ring protein FliF
LPEELLKFRQKIAEFWSNLEKGQKTRLYITSAIVALCVFLGLVIIYKPNYVTLIRNSDAKQIGEMSSILNDNKIWNSIENGGSSIIIKSKDNNRAQVALAQKGYPKNGITFEDAISLIGISTTESDKKHIWKQQKTSDLENKLQMLDTVESASVILALPERSIFTFDNQEPSEPTAYVMVKPRERLNSKQVQAVVMIVSRSVEDLKPENVTVVDNNLNILNNDTRDSSIYTANNQEELRAKKALELQNRVYEYFSVGQFDNFDTIRVVANPVLDFDTLKEQKKIISNPKDMDAGAVISSEISSENLVDGSMGVAPGADSNPGTVDAPSYQIGDEENSSYQKQHEITNYVYDETLSESEKAIGVLIPEKSTMAISLWYGKRVTDQDKLTDEFISQVKMAASTATGIPEQNISVNRMRLAQPEEVEITTSDKAKDVITKYGLPSFLLLLSMVLMIALILRKNRNKELEEAKAQAEAKIALETEVSSSEETLLDIDLDQMSEVKRQIDKFVDKKPEAVAQLLRNWLSDDLEY